MSDQTDTVLEARAVIDIETLRPLGIVDGYEVFLTQEGDYVTIDLATGEIDSVDIPEDLK
jgi:hypothetical protein